MIHTMWLLTLLFPLMAVVAKNLDTGLDYLANENQDIALNYLTTENQVLSVNYLAKYGYLSADTTQARASVSGEKMREAVRQFQASAGLDQTGQVDNNTLELMKMPRCGVRDVGNRTTRYVRTRPKWQKRDLTYRITKYSKHRLTQAQIDKEFRKAFAMWERVTNLRFRKTSGRADIEIRFEVYSHPPFAPNVHSPFDGPSGAGGTVLAHAFDPGNWGNGLGGDIHMDDSETWTVGFNNDLLQVATHEIGHSLGLDHSDNRNTIMFNTHIPMTTVHLTSEDVERIQQLYGRK